ncbi:hypothetical protein BJ878DRAFT_501740 [Calycina marina]|uniref:Uncharacterized protein n=1 Tax=Calycina marina TaxID=1763456 RepID=A0A9P7Z5P2_9HELO|nr:hypothetical protein BJ878DRAFT_501740 [Calycina marina]
MILASASDERLCPVRAVKQLLREYPQPPGAPLFRRYMALFTPTFLEVCLRDRLQRCGFDDPKRHNKHSWRIGSTTQASQAGMTDEEMMRLGRW